MKFNVGVSKRHVHLTKDVFLELFGHGDLMKRNDLNQKGEYASIYKVDLKNGDKILKDVRIVGPFRDYNQVEINEKEAEYLNLNPPVRKSGDLKKSEDIILVNENREYYLKNSLIIAEIHVHLDQNMADEFNLKDDETVMIHKNDEHLFDANIKVTENGYPEIHIDDFIAESHNLKNKDEVSVVRY